MKKVLVWLPRILSILISLFFLSFILEGFSADFSLTDSLVHILFSLPIIAITILAWKYPKLGGAIFMLIGGTLTILIHKEWQSLIFVGVVPFVTGILFYLSTKKVK